MIKDPLLNVVLPKVPQNWWNSISNIYTFFSPRIIGSPIIFSHNNFRLQEYRMDTMPEKLFGSFLDFCYPEDLPNRKKEIACDRENYWNATTTFIVFKEDTIVGCVQIVPRTATQHLPVEYGRIHNTDKTFCHLDLEEFIPLVNITEIYRCRRSFQLSKIEAVNVLLMLYKAVWAKVIQSDTNFTLISFDSEEKSLRTLYLNKLAFDDPHISLTFGDKNKKWDLLIKDWRKHEYYFANLSKPHFFIQTWFRTSLKKKHLKTFASDKKRPQKATLITEEDLLFTQTICLPQRKKRLKGFRK